MGCVYIWAQEKGPPLIRNLGGMCVYMGPGEGTALDQKLRWDVCIYGRAGLGWPRRRTSLHKKLKWENYSRVGSEIIYSFYNSAVDKFLSNCEQCEGLFYF